MDKTPLAILAASAEGGIVVEDDHIEELIGSDASRHSPVDATFDASDHVVIPGLVNTHHHMFQTLTRAHPRAINKELFARLDALLPMWTRHLNPDNFRLAVRLALTELLTSGCTTVSDHQYLYPTGLDAAMDIEAEEAAALGVRMTLTRGSLNLKTEEVGHAPSERCQGVDVILADCERVLARYHNVQDGAMTRVALGSSLPGYCRSSNPRGRHTRMEQDDDAQKIVLR